MKNLILYHANCADGAWSAWAALQALDDAIAVPAAYNASIPTEVSLAIDKGADIYLVDFSYPRDVLEDLMAQLAGNGGKLMVLDHHETAMNDLSGLSQAVFDMERSGAVLTWDCFSSQPWSKIFGLTRPKILDYVQDRDLWKHKLPWTRQIYAAMSKVFAGTKPDQLTRVAQLTLGESPTDNAILCALREQGQELFGERMEKIRAAVFEWVDSPQWTDLGDGPVPCIQAEQHWSDIANMLCQMFLERPYAVAIRHNGDQLVLDLRSLGFPVNKVASNLGGGGHRCAAGCPFPQKGLPKVDPAAPLSPSAKIEVKPLPQPE